MKDLVVFDLDETLLNGDSMTLWHQFLVDKGFATAPDFLALDTQFMAAYADGSLDLDAYLAFSLSPLKHMLAEDINALAARFAKDALMPLIFPEAIVTLAQYKDEGVALAIVSASPSFLVKPVAKALGVETAMGIDLVLNNGKYQPQPEGVPSFREEKCCVLLNGLAALTTILSESVFTLTLLMIFPCVYLRMMYTSSTRAVNCLKKQESINGLFTSGAMRKASRCHLSTQLEFLIRCSLQNRSSVKTCYSARFFSSSSRFSKPCTRRWLSDEKWLLRKSAMACRRSSSL